MENHRLEELLNELLAQNSRQSKQLESLEKTANGLSDELNDIKRHLNMNWQRRNGKRHGFDIYQYMELVIQKDPKIGVRQVFYQIVDFLAANEGMTDGWQHDKFIGPIKNEEQAKKYEDWEKIKFEEWKDQIEFALKNASEQRDKQP